jgi:hypothetical protein
MYVHCVVDMSLGLCVEWAKSRARAFRWKEELMLISEEMRRSVEFCRTMARIWDSRKDLRSKDLRIESHILEGIRAYAVEQAETERKRASIWTADWLSLQERGREVLDKSLKEIEEDIALTTIVVPEMDPLDLDVD